MRLRPAERFARAVVRARLAIIAGWIAAVPLAFLLLPSLEEAQSGALGDLVPTDAAALDAELRSAELFGFPLLSRTVIVQRDPEGMTPESRRRALELAAALDLGQIPRFRSILGAAPFPNIGGGPPLMPESGTSILTFLLFDPDIGRLGQEGLSELLIRREISEPGDAVVGVTGALPARNAQAEVIEDALPLVELFTVLLVALAVGVHYRAVLAPIVTLFAVAIAYLVGIRLVALAGRTAGIAVPSEIEPVIVVLLFGILTDYAIFLYSRFRRRLDDGEDEQDAARGTTADLAPILLTAGSAVALAGAALIVADLGFIRAFGPGLAIAVATGLAVGLTFIPACIATFGGRLFWPSRAAAEEETPDELEGRPVRSRALRAAAMHPKVTIAACVVALLIPAIGLRDLEVGQTLIRGLPADTEARQAYEAAERGFAPGTLSPTVLIVEGPRIGRLRGPLADLQERIEALPGVAAVAGPREQPLELAPGAVLAGDGNAARYVIVYDADPLGARAIRHVNTLRLFMPAILRDAGLQGARWSVAGDTALSEETVRLARSDLGKVAPVTLIVVLVVLAIFLRALLAPLYLAFASVLGLAAALGLTVLVFGGELTFYVPFTAAVLLLALGCDYSVFLAGRIWDEAKRLPLREAVAVAGARASSAITVAGIVLAASFALLALVPLRPFRELAFAMVVGLLIDAFVVRTLLVPALISAFGRR